MSKGWKITLYVILILAINAIVWFILGNKNPDVEIQDNTDLEALAGDDTEAIPETVDNETPTFEEDVMKDLEGFFGNNNGYEDIQGEYGFTSPENE